MDLDLSHPALEDLRRTAKRRIPHFAFEYLDSGTGRELQVKRNRDALDAVLFKPEILRGPADHDWRTDLLGTTYDLPFGIAPVGMSGLIWPGAEKMLAATAQNRRIPYGLSSVATQLPEDIGPIAGDMGWFQLYCPADPAVRQDILRRAKASGFRKLIFTVDVPDDSRRERQRRANLNVPLKITPYMIWEVLTHPKWAVGTARVGKPTIKLAESYLKNTKSRSSTNHAGMAIRGKPDWETFKILRDEWDGPMLVKGIQSAEMAKRTLAIGADALWVSNHSGRQLEAGPAAITQLPEVRAAVGPDVPLVFDSGVATGVDIMRAYALGANYVMMGRAWHYAAAAFGQLGIDHLIHILMDDIVLNMAQIGAQKLSDLPSRVLTS